MRIRAGTLEVALTADGSGFQSALKQADSVSDAFANNVTSRMKRARAGFNKLGEAVGATGEELASLETRMRTGLAADSASRALDNLAKYAGLTRTEIANLEERMGLAAKEAQTLERKIQDGWAAFSRYAKEVGMADSELADLEKRYRSGMGADAAAKACSNVAKYMGLTKNEAADLERTLGIASKQSDKSANSFASLAKKAAVAAAAYVSFRAAVGLIGDSFTSFKDYESALTDMARVTDESLSAIDARIKALPRELGDPTSMMQIGRASCRERV